MTFNDAAMRARVSNISDPAPWRRVAQLIPWPTPNRTSMAGQTFSSCQPVALGAHPCHARIRWRALVPDRNASPGKHARCTATA